MLNFTPGPAANVTAPRPIAPPPGAGLGPHPISGALQAMAHRIQPPHPGSIGGRPGATTKVSAPAAQAPVAGGR